VNVRFHPCELQDGHVEPCYRCAVEAIIRVIGWDPYCQCLREGRPFCEKACGKIRADWKSAIAAAEPPYSEWAATRLASRGLVLHRCLELNDDYEYVDVTNQIMAGRYVETDSGGVTEMRWNADAAAQELSAEIEVDPISFDAALLLVSEEIRSGNPVPAALRDWASDVIVGTLKRPKLSGKIRGATIERDRLILALLHQVVKKRGLKPTSGDRENGQSACHAVAQAFSLLRIQPDSYESIRGIWNRRSAGELRMRSFPRRV
jgi:hypothetical protein